MSVIKHLILALIILITTPIFSSDNIAPSPVSLLHLSVFSEYTLFDLDSLEQQEAQDKLEAIFQDKLIFVTNHDVRKFIIKVLNPEKYAFFHPNTFSLETADNFFYFLSHILEHTEVELLFDETPFVWDTSEVNSSLAVAIREGILFDFEQVPSFANFEEKLIYFDALLIPDHLPTKAFSVTDIVIKGKEDLFLSDLQVVINNFDKYRFSSFSALGPRHISMSVVLDIENKSMAIANLASFPLHNDIRLDQDGIDIGIDLPENFPSAKPHFPSPSWRQKASMADKSLSLLGFVYLHLGSDKLCKELYHDKQILPLPSQYTPKALPQLAQCLENIFTSTPYTQGPGYISALKDGTLLKGRYTFFKEGSKEGLGRFIAGQKIGMFLEESESMLVRSVVTEPNNNTDIVINAPLSFDKDLTYQPYYYSPFAVNWLEPRLSRAIVARLFYVFDVNYTPGKTMAQGDWHLVNFLHFLVNTKNKTGFLYSKLFLGLDDLLMGPNNNLVISDYSGIPNGFPYGEIDWHMGNKAL